MFSSASAFHDSRQTENQNDLIYMCLTAEQKSLLILFLYKLQEIPLL